MPASPRTRPAKSALSREAVVAAALAVVDEVGVDAASMRRVAAALDTGPASLYVYVADRRELMEAAHDLALAGVELPTAGDWRDRLEQLVARVVAALAEHGDLAMAAIAAVPLGPHFLRITEEMLRLLREGGIADPACAWAVDLLVQYVASSALEQGPWNRAQREIADPARATVEAMGADFAGRIDAVYAGLDPEAFPAITALRPLLTTGGGDERDAWKLRVVVDGLLAQG
ncbi:TetR family transcriptional regulator [Actinomycetospora sp. NBRC 106375]|uniref:TetR/AcrR family transcriptional regulator C-terminal domain-containing protein n=1 Tax=Actinomycetospora sp. NBRC 106375 TaxID=3032207 RepID=UPI0024A5E7D4|nr:TetR/AcrR family transcriptional regulator C-terminal domain-containing protein [Actinomycetospora sp. NBRC 106375]GLZ48571.1 TetR family transcriptional regulator [Actinomycetospora sp. NBRC 106375]